jgi:hypothetical protein
MPSTESEQPGISRGLECEPAEGARSLRDDPKPEEENDIVDAPPDGDGSNEWLTGLVSLWSSGRGAGRGERQAEIKKMLKEVV